MRLVIGSIMHESNTFSPLETNLGSFEDTQLLFGREIVARHINQKTEIGGILGVARGRDVEIVPTVSAIAMPSGKVTEETFRFLRSKLLKGIKETKNIDGVLLVLHGAMVTTHTDDPEGLLLKEVRKLVGKDVYIGVTLDHHANVSQLMTEKADFLIAYRTHPHVDQYETGRKAADIMLDLLNGKNHPVMRMKKIPMLIPAESSPMPRAKLVHKLEELEKKKGIISASFFIGYPFADIREVGPSVVVITEDNESLAEKEADEFARLMWELRNDFALKAPSIDDTLDEILAGEEGPFVFGDLGDCILAGGTGDETAFLAALLKKRVRNACLTLIDPEAIRQCVAAGIGKRVTLDVGGKLDQINSHPLRVTGLIESISDGKYFGKGYDLAETEIDMGRTVVLKVNGIELVLTEKRSPVHDPALFRSLKIEPSNKKIIVLKDAFYLTITYKSIAKKIIFFNSPGVCNWNFSASNYHNLPRPIYPFDSMVFGKT